MKPHIIIWFQPLLVSLSSLCCQGASSSWWNYRHYLHHAKPNRMSMDPDIRMDKLFVLGSVQPVEVSC